jgi:hypothetical protein
MALTRVAHEEYKVVSRKIRQMPSLIVVLHNKKGL